jgi:hypothetical protein
MVNIQVSPTQTVSLTKTDDPGFQSGTIAGLQSGKFDLKEGHYQVIIK